jgi:hypothetical protein
MLRCSSLPRDVHAVILLTLLVRLSLVFDFLCCVTSSALACVAVLRLQAARRVVSVL